MILHHLCNLYSRWEAEGKVAPPGYKSQGISFEIVITNVGGLVAINDVRITKGKKKFPRIVRVFDAPPRTTNISAQILWDGGKYLLGYVSEKDKPERIAECFKASCAAHLMILDECPDEGMRAVATFLQDWKPTDCVKHPILSEVGEGFGVFRLEGDFGFVHERPAVAAWWRAKSAAQGRGEGDESSEIIIGQCLVTGKQAPLARLHPKIKGVRGSQSMSLGSNLVSFQQPAFESYGKVQGENAPIGESAMFQYSTALNALLQEPAHRWQIGGDTTCVFWTEEKSEAETALKEILEGSSEEEVQVESIRSFFSNSTRGLPTEVPSGDIPFFLLGLTPNMGRLSIRFFHQSTVGSLWRNLSTHAAQMELFRAVDNGKFISAYDILLQTARTVDDIPPLLGGALASAILTGGRYPDSILAAILRRVKADGKLWHPRVAYIKAHLIRNYRKEISVALDENHPDLSYHLGRLFAMLEKIQLDAMGNVNCSLKDKYFSAASATPQRIFPGALQTAQYHLKKIGKKNKGLEIWWQRQITAIMERVQRFPSCQTLEMQGVFMVGYYHQNQYIYTPRQKDAELAAATNSEDKRE